MILHFFEEFSHVSSQKCTWFAIEGMFLLSEKTGFVITCGCAVLVEAFVMACTEPKTLPVWMTLVKISDNKDRKEIAVR